MNQLHPRSPSEHFLFTVEHAVEAAASAAGRIQRSKEPCNKKRFARATLWSVCIAAAYTPVAARLVAVPKSGEGRSPAAWL